jgi:hypothetical protein
MTHTSLIKQETLFLLRLILNPMAEGLHSTSEEYLRPLSGFW